MRWQRKARPKTEHVYHASAECLLDEIQIWGIRNWGAGIYVSETPEDALALTGWKLWNHQHQEGIERHDEIIVWEIQTGKLTTGRWTRGTDHSPEIFGDATSWVYSDDIPRWAISGATAYTRSDMEDTEA